MTALDEAKAMQLRHPGKHIVVLIVDPITDTAQAGSTTDTTEQTLAILSGALEGLGCQVHVIHSTEN